MGDVVHTLPALSDAASANPSIRFDWAVDESFAQIPAWHRNVETVFSVALRRWQGNLSSSAGRAEVKAFLKTLRDKQYDLVVDLQGEFKSALIARVSRGTRAGYDGASAREWGAQLLITRRCAVPKGAHSMKRMRDLLAKALSYSYDNDVVDYGIETHRFKPTLLEIARPYIVFLHSTSWEAKNWPESYWRELADKVTAAGFAIVLPWGSEVERRRSLNIAGDHSNHFVLPKLSISEKASIIKMAVATVGLDTGLSHIAAALGVPSVTLYGATDPALCGTIGKDQVQIASEFECVKCHETTCSFKASAFKPACFEMVEPGRVWRELERLIGKTSARRREVYQLA